MSDAPPHDPPAFRRHVFYVPGYDPMPPRSYRERYRREAARQAALSGHEIMITPDRPNGAAYGWQIAAVVEGQRVETRYTLLKWSDIVQGSMAHGVLATYGQLLRTAWIYLSSGAFFRLARLRKGPVIAALYPVALLMLQLAIATAAGAGIAVVLARLLTGVLPTEMMLPLLSIAVLIAGVLTAWAVLTYLRRRDPLLAWYLMQDYAFASQHAGAYPAAQEARMADFANQITEALSTDADEVLVVGHSSGAYIAVSVLADLIRAGHVPVAGPSLSLLTLGQVIPMVSFLPRADRLRADLAFLSRSDALAWVDVSAPGDGCAFALCDPVAVSGSGGPGKRWPLVLSAAFSKTLTSESQERLRWRFFERHFQYLNAFDALPDDPAAYDYFAVTAGPRRLIDRFGGRNPSAQRIERAVSRYPVEAA